MIYGKRSVKNYPVKNITFDCCIIYSYKAHTENLLFIYGGSRRTWFATSWSDDYSLQDLNIVQGYQRE